MAYRFVTIGPSHYCEKVRWALDRHGVDYAEDPHAPALHIPRVRWLGGKPTVPLLIAPQGEVFNDSTLALEHLEVHATEATRLYPDGALGDEVRALEDRLDEVLGVHARRLAYLHLLYAKKLRPVMSHGVGAIERSVFCLTLPLLRPLMKRAMNVTPEAGDRSRAKVLAELEEVERLLSDGRSFLTGDRFTAADLTFASLLAPFLCPPEYGWPMPRLTEFPESFQAEARPLIERKAGQFGLRLYREHRQASPVALSA